MDKHPYDAEAAQYQRRTATVERTTAAEVQCWGFSDLVVVNRTCGTPTSGVPVHRAAMSEGRFSFLFLQFAKPDTRKGSRKIWDTFKENCTKLYVPRAT